jgi:hypothetical protein
VRAALFFTHSREAPSLVGHAYDTGLASRLRSAQMKLWDMFYNFVTGYGGSGGCLAVLHTLLEVTHDFISQFKNVHVVHLCLALAIKILSF